MQWISKKRFYKLICINKNWQAPHDFLNHSIYFIFKLHRNVTCVVTKCFFGFVASETPPGKPVYKSMDYSMDSNRRSDRAEWCTIYYHDNYCPDQAFSLELHWMVSTASIISERVSQYFIPYYYVAYSELSKVLATVVQISRNSSIKCNR